MPVRLWHVVFVVVGVLVLVVLSVLFPSGRDAPDPQTARPPATAPPPTTVQARPAPPPPPTTRQSCAVSAEITHTRQWLRSCHLLGKLTTECKKIFDSEGGYTVPESETPDRLRQWMTDSTACSCELPRNVVAQLNETLKSDKEVCAIQFPEPSKK